MQIACRAVAHDDDEALAGEDVHLAELDLLGLVDVARRVEHEEVAVLVVLELRPLVGLHRVLDGELGEVEALGDVEQLVGVGVVQAEPDEAVVLAAFGSLVDREWRVVLSTAVLVVGAVDEHGVGIRSPGAARRPGARGPRGAGPPARAARRARMASSGTGGTAAGGTGWTGWLERMTRASTNSAERAPPLRFSRPESQVALSGPAFQW